MKRSLGERQKSVLRCLHQHGAYPLSAWLWNTRSETEAICEALVKRRLVIKNRPHKVGWPVRYVLNPQLKALYDQDVKVRGTIDYGLYLSM